MRIANKRGRLVLAADDGVIDVESASAGTFSADPQAIYSRWEEFISWAASTSATPTGPLEITELEAPVPRPSQVLAVGVNYADHVEESHMTAPDEPVVFTKFASCLTGPRATIPVQEGSWTDWEAELVVVIGRRAEYVAVEEAWTHVAGLTVGQDISDRLLQFRGPAPQQFSLGKSRPGFGPLGPWVSTIDEFRDPDDLALTCALDGTVMQAARTSQMLFSVPQLISQLSAVLPLLPGDLIFTGTPGGIGAAQQPPQFLTAGQVLVSHIEGIGELRNPIVAAAGA